MTLSRTTPAPARAAALTLVLAVGLTACGTGSPGPTASDGTQGSGTSADAEASVKPTAVKDLDPRIAITYDGGILIVDTSNGQTVADIKKEGFLRLNPAGDGRHVLVTGDDGFEVLDMGLIARSHGDHFHYYTQPPALTGSIIRAEEGGHVVTHAGRTAVWADGTGTATSFSVDALSDGRLDQDELAAYTAGAPHHGVAVPLSNGHLIVTEGGPTERHTVREVTADGATVTEITDCPGVHGDATAQGTDVVSLGCENGSVVYRDGAFHKVSVPEEYERSGNQAGSPDSPYVLTDYKTVRPVKGGEPEHPTRVGILNTADATTTTVELDSAYWFRSLARGAKGEALVLTGNGRLNIIDPTTASVSKQVDVVSPWTENKDWQQPGPNLTAAGDFAYVTDPTAKTLAIVQISSGRLVSTLDLPVVPNETAVIDAEVDAETAAQD